MPTSKASGMRNKILLIAMVVGLVSVGSSDASTSFASPRTATALNDTFHTYGDTGEGWTGGDSTYSVELPDGRTAWIFSDTFLGPISNEHGRSSSAPLIHNSIVVEDNGVLSTRYSSTLLGPRALIEPVVNDGVSFYWLGDGTVEGDKLRVFCLRFVVFGWNFIQVATDIATFSLPQLALESIEPSPSGLPPTAAGAFVSYGSAITETADYTYVYGVEDLHSEKYLHLARISTGVLGQWEYYTGSGWSSSPLASVRLLEGIANEFSVAESSGGFRLITSDHGIGKDIHAYTAPAPEGPWGARQTLYSTPETGGNLITYNAKEHPQYSRDGTTVISYNVNSFDFSDLYRDVHIYRPRFVEVSL